MRTLKGKVNCSTKTEIEDGAVAYVSVNDTCLMDVEAKQLGRVEIKNPKSFPFNYEVEFDQSEVMVQVAYGFTVSVRIEKNGKLLFINDTSHSIIGDNGILDNVDINVIAINTIKCH